MGTLSEQQPVLLSIIIPAFNEERRIGQSLQRILDFLKESTYSWEIIVVNDGSNDRTAEVVRTESLGDLRLRLLNNPGNRGKGYSVRHGVQNSIGEMVLLSDADLSTPITELEKLIPWLRRGVAVAIGSRALKGSDLKVRQPFFREIGGRGLNLLIRLLALPGIADSRCGFKLFQGELARSIFPKVTIDGFGFDDEALFLVRKRGGLIKEVPVVWINSRDSRLSPFRDGPRALRELIQIKWNSLRGVYDN